MMFRILWDPEDKSNVIVGEGQIQEGDKERLEKVIPLAGRDRYGNIPLYLNSPGGSVKAAFEIIELMDRQEFSALSLQETVAPLRVRVSYTFRRASIRS